MVRIGNLARLSAGKIDEKVIQTVFITTFRVLQFIENDFQYRLYEKARFCQVGRLKFRQKLEQRILGYAGAGDDVVIFSSSFLYIFAFIAIKIEKMMVMNE